ncbi:FG-GAP-like repeat-containing protein [Embleya sp. NPDC001921]
MSGSAGLRRSVPILASLCVAVAASVVAAAPPSHAAVVGFQMPFTCDQSWTGSVRTNHSPPLAIDWTRGGPSSTLNQPVTASAGGTVSTVADRGNTSYGKYVVVTHANGWQTLYAHLNSFDVQQGDTVAAGSRLGRVGSTGNSTGPHLHYEQKLNGTVQQSVFNGAKFVDGTTLTSRNCASTPEPPQQEFGMTKMVSGDFDANGTTDIAAVDVSTGKLGFYPGNGGGAFGTPSTVGTGWDGVSNLVGGDFNGDGRADIAGVGGDGTLYIYPGNGVGSFGTPIFAGTGWNNLDQLTAGDFNGDGKSDVAAVGKGDGNLYVYPGNGVGSFSTPIFAGTGWNNLDQLSGGDFNGDGKSDIAAVGKGDGVMYIYPGNGVGAFDAAAPAGSGWSIMRTIVSGDFNGDGRTDLDAVQAPQGATGDMYLYPGTGQNTFGSRIGVGTGW